MAEGRHDDVLSRLLELQTRLRKSADEPSDGGVRLADQETLDLDIPTTDDSITVSQPDVVVTGTLGSEPELASVSELRTAAAEERVAALSDRLKRLESELSSVITRIDLSDAPRKLRSDGDGDLVKLQSEIASKLDQERWSTE
jgi:hypothetical protein